MRIVKAIGFNLLGVILGIIGGNLAYKIASFILINLLGNLGWLKEILSWPVPYYYYALTGIAGAHAFASIGIANFFGTLANTKIKYSCIIVGLDGFLGYLLRLIGVFSEEGFSFKILIVFLVMMSFFVFMTFSSLINEDYNENKEEYV